MVPSSGVANVLIVDDEDIIRRSIQRTLSRGGYSCFEASCGEEALRVLDSHPMDLVILDVMMPGIPGTRLLPEIRNKYPHTAVVMATAVDNPDTIIACMKNGASDYLPKPFEMEELSLAAQNALMKQNLQTELNNHIARLENKVKHHTSEIRQLTLASFEAVVNALEAKDTYTAGHSKRVSRYAKAIGVRLGLSGQELENLVWGAILHDVGKIAIDSNIQNKPSRLSSEEYCHVMSHVHIGPGIVEPVANRDMREIIEHHHDFYDGSRPEQLCAGEDIPLGARIVAVADTFDAITSNRPYRSAMPGEMALAELKKCQGTQFDPLVVQAFLDADIPELTTT